MSLRIEPTRFAEGIWRALLNQPSDLKAPPPKIDVLLQGRPIRGVLLIVEQGSSKVLSRIVLSGGDLNGEDLRAEMAELRAEIDLLKRLFRASRKSGF